MSLVSSSSHSLFVFITQKNDYNYYFQLHSSIHLSCMLRRFSLFYDADRKILKIVEEPKKGRELERNDGSIRSRPATVARAFSVSASST
jgi:hypothetical protein